MTTPSVPLRPIPAHLLPANQCPLCDWIYRRDAPPTDIDTAVSVHVDLEHTPSEILGLLRRGREAILHKPSAVGIDDGHPDLVHLD
jgi:hypothetical protein